MQYTIYFEIYGKKLKTTVSASSEDQAKQIIKDKIIFHKIEKENKQKHTERDFNDIFSFLNIK